MITLTARINQLCQSYHASVEYLTTISESITNGREFMYAIKDAIEGSSFNDCNKINVDPFYGYLNEFGLTFYHNNKRFAWVKIKNKDGVLEVNQLSWDNFPTRNSKEAELFRATIKKFITMHNRDFYIDKCFECFGEINVDTDTFNVALDIYKDYKITEKKKLLTDTLPNIFSTFTSMNETLKYCNGDYYEFNNKEIEKLYHIYTSMYKGNYFLMNAVKDGRLID